MVGSDVDSGAALRYIVEDAPTGTAMPPIGSCARPGPPGRAVEYRGWSNTRAGVAPALHAILAAIRAPASGRSTGAPTVAHLVPEYYPLVRSVVPPGPFVAHTVWESDRLPRHWPELLDGTDLVIVPTEWNRTVFRASGVHTPVEVVPHVATVVVPGDAAVRSSVRRRLRLLHHRSVGRTQGDLPRRRARTSARSPPTTRWCWW